MPKTQTGIKKAVEKEKKPSCQIDALDIEGKVVEKLNLPEKIFAARVNEKLMAQAVRVYLANQRQGTQKTKSRGEVVASTAKIWRQKGTGRARHGARSAPIFVGGGVAHGPKPRDFSLKMPQKMRQKALFSALSDKLKEKRILVVKGLEEIKPKTREMFKILTNLKIGKEKKESPKLLIVLPGKLENLERAARNIAGVTLAPAPLLNTYLVLSHQNLLFLPASLPVLAETFLGQKKKAEEQKKEKVGK